MFKRKAVKIAFVLFCLVTLIMPYTSPVLAAVLTQGSQSDELMVLELHEGGDESSGTLEEDFNSLKEKYPDIYTGEYGDYVDYDDRAYIYTVGGTKVFKIVSATEMPAEVSRYQNEIYCIDALRTFPAITSTGDSSLTYYNEGDLADSTNINVKTLHMGADYSEDNSKWSDNYQSLIWLINHLYLRKQSPEQKNAYLARAFSDLDENELFRVKVLLTDDDIEVVQQRAIWYFTNNDDPTYATDTLPAIELTTVLGTSGSYNDLTGSSLRQTYANTLYQYLINTAKERPETETVTFPEIVDKNATSSTNGDYYVVGPFHINSGTANASDYTIKLLDQSGNEINRSDYSIMIEGGEEPTNKNVNEIFDLDFYICIPKTNTSITTITLNLDYSKFATEASLWENDIEADGKKVYQPVTLITRGEQPYNQHLSVNIDRKTADLALRKYIIKVNNTTVNRAPEVDISDLKDGKDTTAKYKHIKEPIEVAVGDKIVYEIRVYNEADIDASGVVIVDSLPNGLELVPSEESTINATYGWKDPEVGNNLTIYKSEYLKNKVINAFNKETDTELPSDYVQIECRVTANATASSILTNIAEIKEDNITDRDSSEGNHEYINNDYDSTEYSGNASNDTDLSKEDYFYKGREDDDDFEKIVIEGKYFDLSLQKFVSKINKKAPTVNREPEVNVNPLVEGKHDAEYKPVKTALEVKQGDIVEYTIRVYNEGELSGYAEEVSDYLPEGLGYIMSYTTNEDNYWHLPENEDEITTPIKLVDIPNAKNNVKLEDFKGITDLSEVEVIPGKIKLTSDKLKSSETSTTNLLKAFDKETKKIDSRDIYVVCVVLTDTVNGNNLRNISEIKKETDENRNEIEDIDSNPDKVNPDDYPNNNEDDDDYEKLTTTEPDLFDLSLKKFITKVNGSVIKDRAPSFVKDSKGNLKIEDAKVSPLRVENQDVITYTIRVYNEGNADGYAAEISDTIPYGLIFLKDNETNEKYKWKMYDKNGKETQIVSEAVTVKTDYLSRDNSTNNLLKAYNPSTDSEFDYKDIEIVFRVDESLISDKTRKLINYAEISDDTDKDGNDVEDIDSKPGNDNRTKNDDGTFKEDDIDKEEIYVKYFDLELIKDLTKIIVTENGVTREISVKPTDGLQKVEIHRKKIDSTIVKFVYTITVKNTGEIEGYATEIKDYIPEGLEFIAEENKQWTKGSGNIVTTRALQNTLLKPGESASVDLVLKWKNDENNMNLKTNIAEISEDRNDSNTPDIDSTPDNKVPEEDDYDYAEVYLLISTGTSQTYIALTVTVLAIMTTGVSLIKKFVL